MVHLFIHICDRRARSPIYGVVSSGCSGITRPPFGSWAPYGGRSGKIERAGLEKTIARVRYGLSCSVSDEGTKG